MVDDNFSVVREDTPVQGCLPWWACGLSQRMARPVTLLCREMTSLLSQQVTSQVDQEFIKCPCRLVQKE